MPIQWKPMVGHALKYEKKQKTTEEKHVSACQPCSCKLLQIWQFPVACKLLAGAEHDHGSWLEANVNIFIKNMVLT